MRAFRHSVTLILLICALFVLTASTAFASIYTWTNDTASTSLSGLHWHGITSSSDGTKLAAVVQGGDIWNSTNSGVTWTNQTTSTSAHGLNWWGITSSSDGTKLAVIVI